MLDWLRTELYHFLTEHPVDPEIKSTECRANYEYEHVTSLLICPVTGVMRRVLPSTDAMSMKIRVLQFLSRINEGERLGEINISVLTITQQPSRLCQQCLLHVSLFSCIAVCTFYFIAYKYMK